MNRRPSLAWGCVLLARNTVNFGSTQKFIDKIDYYAVKGKNEQKSIIVLSNYKMKVEDYIKGNHNTKSPGRKIPLK